MSHYFEGGSVLTASISCFVTSHAKMGRKTVKDAQPVIEDGWQSLRLNFGQSETNHDPPLYKPRDSIDVTAR